MRPRYTSLITTTTIRLIMNRNDNVTLSSPVYLFLSVARAHNHWSPHYTHHKFSLHLCVCLLFSRYRTFLRYGFLFDLYIFNFSSSHFLRITFSVCRKNARHICRVLLQMCVIFARNTAMMYARMLMWESSPKWSEQVPNHGSIYVHVMREVPTISAIIQTSTRLFFRLLTHIHRI